MMPNPINMITLTLIIGLRGLFVKTMLMSSYQKLQRFPVSQAIAAAAAASSVSNQSGEDNRLPCPYASSDVPGKTPEISTALEPFSA
jgi:hypothetical protein